MFAITLGTCWTLRPLFDLYLKLERSDGSGYVLGPRARRSLWELVAHQN